MLLHYIGKLKLQIFCRYWRKCKQIAFLIAFTFVIHTQILIFSVFKIAKSQWHTVGASEAEASCEQRSSRLSAHVHMAPLETFQIQIITNNLVPTRPMSTRLPWYVTDSPVGLRLVIALDSGTTSLTVSTFSSCSHKLMVKVNKQKNSDTENLIYNQYGERLAILNAENIKICEWITKIRGV